MLVQPRTPASRLRVQIASRFGRYAREGLETVSPLQAVARGLASAVTLFEGYDDKASFRSWEALTAGALIDFAGATEDERVTVEVIRPAARVSLAVLGVADIERWSKLDGRNAAFIATMRARGCRSALFVAFKVRIDLCTRFRCEDCRDEYPLAALDVYGDPTSSSGACKLCGSRRWNVISADGAVLA